MPDKTGGINKFAMMLDTRARQVNESAQTIDFGVIQSDMSLKTQTFGIPIPRSGYRVCRSLAVGAAGTTLVSVLGGEHTQEVGNGRHTHDIPIPEGMRSLLPGDEVLVVWAGNTAVVVDILMKR